MLKDRISAILNLIKGTNNYIVDVGSDHATLSIFAIKQNKANFVSNIEINIGPLLIGKKNVQKENLQNKIDFYHNDGFKNLLLNKQIDYVCISGLGANTIIDIISNNVSNIPHYYVLQANQNISKLRKYLLQNNFYFIDEIVVFENNKYYEIILVSTNNKIKNNFDNNDIYIGPILKTKEDHLLRQYLLNKNDYFNKIYSDKLVKRYQEEILTVKKFINEKEWIS